MELTIVVHELSDDQLIQSISRLVVKEREVIYGVLLHLIEIESRRVHLWRGYRSLYDYCVRGLKYSGSAAQRRIRAARALKCFPQIGPRIKDGALSLSTLGVVAELLTEDNLDDLLDEVAGKSREEVAKIVARHKPVSAVMLQESIEPLVVRQDTTRVRHDALRFGDGALEDTSCRADVEHDLQVTQPSQEESYEEEFYKVTFTATKEMKAKLDRARELMARTGRSGIDEVVLKALDAYLEKHCPKKRLERRLKRKAKLAEKKPVCGPKLLDVPSVRAKESALPKRSRYIPIPLRDQVLARDGHRCTYVSEIGICCETNWGLEIDHIVPFAMGGTNTLDNLQTVCRAHNQMYAIEFFGEKHIMQKIEERRRTARKRQAAGRWIYDEPSTRPGNNAPLRQ